MGNDPAMGEPRKRITQMTYDLGPMGFLNDQIIKELQRAGYPAKTFQIFRSAEDQQRFFDKGTSKARPWSGAHQFYGATDIIHEQWAWGADKHAPPLDRFWDTLWDCAELVSQKFGVEFRARISWDPAHIELISATPSNDSLRRAFNDPQQPVIGGWRDMRRWIGKRHPTQAELDRWFEDALPKQWKQHVRSKAYENRS